VHEDKTGNAGDLRVKRYQSHLEELTGEEGQDCWVHVDISGNEFKMRPVFR
jgi:hypothetical protein